MLRLILGAAVVLCLQGCVLTTAEVVAGTLVPLIPKVVTVAPQIVIGDPKPTEEKPVKECE